MGLINNDKLYPKDILISLGDMVIGSDKDKNGETKNYNLGGVYDLINTLNGKKAASYRYSSDDPDTTVGVFNITGNTFKFNEKDAREIDNTAFFNVLKNNKELVLLSLKIGVNEFNYFKITNVTQNLNSFSFELVALGTTNVNSFLLDENYNMSIDIVGSGQAQIQSDWNQADALQKDFIKNKPALFSGSYNDLSDKPNTPTVPNLEAVTFVSGATSNSIDLTIGRGSNARISAANSPSNISYLDGAVNVHDPSTEMRIEAGAVKVKNKASSNETTLQWANPVNSTAQFITVPNRTGELALRKDTVAKISPNTSSLDTNASLNAEYPIADNPLGTMVAQKSGARSRYLYVRITETEWMRFTGTNTPAN